MAGRVSINTAKKPLDYSPNGLSEKLIHNSMLMVTISITRSLLLAPDLLKGNER